MFIPAGIPYPLTAKKITVHVFEFCTKIQNAYFSTWHWGKNLKQIKKQLL